VRIGAPAGNFLFTEFGRATGSSRRAGGVDVGVVYWFGIGRGAGNFLF
jgi:hypothetical protein